MSICRWFLDDIFLWRFYIGLKWLFKRAAVRWNFVLWRLHKHGFTFTI